MDSIKISRCLYLILTLLFVTGGADLYAQIESGYERRTATFQFKLDNSVLDQDFGCNSESADALIVFLDHIGVDSVDSLRIISGASLEGSSRYNQNLSHKRSTAVKSWLLGLYPSLESKTESEDKGELWDEFLDQVQQDTVISDKEKQKIVGIIVSDVSIDTKKWRLKRCPSYRYISRTYYPLLRTSTVTVFYRVPLPEVKSAPVSALTYVPQPIQIPRSVPVSKPEVPKDEIFYLRTNLLAPLSNFGAAYCINDRWSIEADYYFPWFRRNPDHRNCFQILGWNLGGRYWFGKDRTREDRLEGHSVGANIAAGYYDFEKDFVGDQGEFVQVGVDYLYSLPVWKDRLHLEFSLGLGYIYSHVKPYDVFEDGGKAYKTGYTENFHWLGPTKATVSLVVPIKVARRAGR